MKLADWIEKKGSKWVAEILEVDEITVYYWRTMKNLPKDHHKRAIKRISRGVVTYSEMIEPYFKAREKSL